MTFERKSVVKIKFFFFMHELKPAYSDSESENSDQYDAPARDTPSSIGYGCGNRVANRAFVGKYSVLRRSVSGSNHSDRQQCAGQPSCRKKAQIIPYSFSLIVLNKHSVDLVIQASGQGDIHIIFQYNIRPCDPSDPG